MGRQVQTRREFCGQACRAASLAALGGTLGSVLEGCGGGGSPTSPSNVPALPVIAAVISNGAITLTIDSSSALNPLGSAALVQTPTGSLLVAHTGQDAFSAVSATCTHQGCTITGFASEIYVCPCHGSRFDTSGRVVNGPASSPLAQFHTQFAGNILTITT